MMVKGEISYEDKKKQGVGPLLLPIQPANQSS